MYNENLDYLLLPPGKVTQIGFETGKPVRQGIARFVSPEGSFRYVMYENEQAIAALQVVDMSKVGKVGGQAANIFVVKERRRQGLGTKLIEAARKDFKPLTLSDDLSPSGEAFKKSIKAGSSIPVGDLLSEALDSWIYRDSYGKLEKLYKDRPDLFKNLDKGLKYKTLYRVVVLKKNELAQLLKKGEIPNRDGLESWSASVKGLQHFSNKYEGNVGDAYVVVLKRGVPVSERVVCVPCIADESPAIRQDDSRVKEEREIIVKRRPIKKEWILRVLYAGEQVDQAGIALPLDYLEKQFKEKVSAKYVLAEATLTLWHGGNLDSNADMIAHKRGRWEYGPGLYLTTHYDTARKYSKGSRKLYKVVVRKGTDISEVRLSMEVIEEFVNIYVYKALRKGILDRLQKYTKDGKAPAEIFLNLMVNGKPGDRNGAIRNSDTDKLRQFLVQNGIDYCIVDNAFGWRERMLVLFNNSLIVEKQVVKPNEKIDQFDLHTDFT